MVVMEIPIAEQETVEFEGLTINLSRAVDGSLGVSISCPGLMLLDSVSQYPGHSSVWFRPRPESEDVL